MYVFEQIPWEHPETHPLGALTSDVGNFPFTPPSGLHFHNLQFYVGEPMTGAPVHYHGSAINALVSGKKRWLLFPPHNASYSKVPAATWGRSPEKLTRLRERGLHFATCVQPADSAMFIPAGWGHAVLNLEASVGGALEFHLDDDLTWSFEQRATDATATAERR